MVAGIKHHIAVEINDLLNIPQGHIQKDRHIAGDALEIPDMGHRGRQFDEAHAVTPDPAFRHLNAAAFADDAAVTNALVLTAVAFPVLGGTEDLFAEQPVHLGLQGAVVDCFRFGDLTHHLPVGQGALPPLHDPVRRGQSDLDVVEVVFGSEIAVGH
ncbi:MAG: Uncharacterised protein [Synechococcus sp. CC9902]|nr:MAG: Uncharacterised protein [Synechococcus sp. CC9902]